MAAARALTDSEVPRVYKALQSPRDRLAFLLGCATGLRAGELLSLTRAHVYDHHGTPRHYLSLTVPVTLKHGKPRTIPLAHFVRTALTHYRKNIALSDRGAALFPSWKLQPEPLGLRQWNRLLTAAFAQAGCYGPLSSHTLRKTFARRCFQFLDGNIFLTQQALGHRSPTTTVYYIAEDRPLIESAILQACAPFYLENQYHPFKVVAPGVTELTNLMLPSELEEPEDAAPNQPQ